jgi:hypothetical protein
MNANCISDAPSVDGHMVKQAVIAIVYDYVKCFGWMDW